MVLSWFIQNPNAFVFVLFAVIFLFFALLSLAHRSTLIFTLFVGIVCGGLGWYFLSPRSIIKQHAR